MGLFNFNKRNNEEVTSSDWIELLQETQNRMGNFLEKLEVRMQELTEAAIPELLSLKLEDERGFGHMLNGVKGQLNTVREKAQETYEEKVNYLYDQIHQQITILHPHYKYLREFRTVCSTRFHQQFDEVFHNCQNQLDKTSFVDYEVVYQQIQHEFENIKNKFNCLQCGGNIPIDKMYFTVSYLKCPYCQTQNTFHPSTLAQGLEHIGRGLAEQRTKPLLDNYQEAQRRERELYHQAHELKLKSYAIQEKKEKEQVLNQISELEHLRMETEKRIPKLYQQYQRAMFDEWKVLVPDLAEQTENFYQNLQKRKL